MPHAYSLTSTPEVLADVSSVATPGIQISKSRPLQGDDLLNSPLNIPLDSQHALETAKLVVDVAVVLLPLIVKLQKTLAERKARALLGSLSSKKTLVLTPETPIKDIEELLEG
jgi:hypothetical protein